MYDKFLVNFLKNNVIANDARRVRAPAGKGQSFHALMPNIATAEINEDGSCVYEIPVHGELQIITENQRFE